ncbi:MAG: gamma-glutamyl-gamma-aminobutyrate hydrolase family protein [Candidatus Dadabacteria bacterium]|nr:gamma-glutamyl-gamma-aminobutyrate hydrolase family protein [Candidatus Dadabacteria bacterium]
MNVAVLKHVPHEHLGTIEHSLRENGVEYFFVNSYEGGSEWVEPDDIDGVIVMGGPMSVYDTDTYTFLNTHERLIRMAVNRGLPVLGICLGAQLVAKSLGAKVIKNNVKEIGWYSLTVTTEGREDRLFGHFCDVETVFQWHGDTFEIPPGGTLLAESELCKNQAYRVGDNVYGLQFHVEITRDMIGRWLEVPENAVEISTLDYIDPAEIRSLNHMHLERMNELSSAVFGEFCRMVLGQ